jgi:hypothetical protein
VNKFLASHQGLVDLEHLLKALYDLFQLLKLTSLDIMTHDISNSQGSLAMLKTSTEELNRLRRELQSQRVNRDDVRYDIFKQLFDIIDDNIDLRLHNNRQTEAIIMLNRNKVVANTVRVIETDGKKGAIGTPGGDFEKRKLTRALKANEIIGESLMQ